MKKAVHFGAGNIGRGFIGLLLHRAGYEVVFADVVPTLIEQLQRAKAYRVLTLDENVEEEQVTDIRAVLLDSDQCRYEIVDADIVTTAVGLGNLSSVAGIIADGLHLRYEQNPNGYLNILACENAIRATSTLKEAVLARLEEPIKEWIGANVGFADVAVDRIAPNRDGYAVEPLDAVVERFFEWDIEQPALKGEIHIAGATFVQELNPFLERKLFMLNGAHATAAYAGFYKGYRTVLEAMKDNDIAALVETVQMESALGLSHRYPMLALSDLGLYAEAVRSRFLNPHIHDDVERVGRDPLRKLSSTDRLVGPLHLAQAATVEPKALVKAIALGLRYDNSNDDAAKKIQKEIQSLGIEAAVKSVTGITDDNLVSCISGEYRSL